MAISFGRIESAHPVVSFLPRLKAQLSFFFRGLCLLLKKNNAAAAAAAGPVSECQLNDLLLTNQAGGACVCMYMYIYSTYVLGGVRLSWAGVALTGDPDYRIVMEAYPFVTRKIISDESPALQRALRDILYR